MAATKDVQMHIIIWDKNLKKDQKWKKMAFFFFLFFYFFIFFFFFFFFFFLSVLREVILVNLWPPVVTKPVQFSYYLYIWRGGGGGLVRHF